MFKFKWWRSEPALDLYWRKNSSGQPGNNLYLGALFVGSVEKSPLVAGEWMFLLMKDVVGTTTGGFKTSDEARSALESAARRAIARGR